MTRPAKLRGRRHNFASPCCHKSTARKDSEQQETSHTQSLHSMCFLLWLQMVFEEEKPVHELIDLYFKDDRETLCMAFFPPVEDFVGLQPFCSRIHSTAFSLPVSICLASKFDFLQKHPLEILCGFMGDRMATFVVPWTRVDAPCCALCLTPR